MEKLKKQEELKTIEIFKRNNIDDNYVQKMADQKEKSSFDFQENREDIMKQFQDNFINIYEGKPLENSYVPESKLRINNKNPQTEIFKSNKNYNSLLPERKKNKSKTNTKRQRLQKILREIERKKMKKIENEELIEKNVIHRNCFNSKIIKKNENVIFLNLYSKNHFFF